ncbi:MAG: PQQ-dependent sugar dehydrogenase, partial [Chloroflexota bacterium]
APVATVAGGPLAFAAPDDGSGRVFVAAKDGRIWILQGEAGVAAPVLDLRELVSNGGEQGLLGLAVHPDFPADPRVFVDYTDKSGDTVVASYSLADKDPNKLDPSTETRILEVDQPHSRHNGGALAFGPDGMLYIALGDGGGAGDQTGNAQRTDTLLGKVLRIDVNVPTGTVPPYVIPAGNPFAGSNSARQEIWLLGLRNPWRMSFDRSTGALWIGDVGQGSWEEIDVAGPGVGGLNFGWRVREGRHCYAPPSGCDSTGLTDPVSEYGHDLGCTVIGGAVYRGSAHPLLIGGYLFADYCSGRLWAIAAAGSGYRAPVLVGTTGGGIAAFGEDAGGELFAANLDGTISRVVATAP